MEVFAFQTLFAESLEEMFTDEGSVCGGRSHSRCSGGRGRHTGWSRMAIWAGRSQWTVSLTVGFADGYIAGKSEAEALAKEGCKSEVIVTRIAGRFSRNELRSGTLYVGHDVSGLERKLKESAGLQVGESARRDHNAPVRQMSVRK